MEMPRLRSIVVRTASSRLRRSARGFSMSLSVSADTGSVRGVAVEGCSANAAAAASETTRIEKNRRTAVMYILLDTRACTKGRSGSFAGALYAIRKTRPAVERLGQDRQAESLSYTGAPAKWHAASCPG